jgi:hypothetical protein
MMSSTRVNPDTTRDSRILSGEPMNPFRKKIPGFGDNLDSRSTPAIAGGNQMTIEVSLSHRLQANAQVSANVAVMATDKGCGIASFRKVIPTTEVAVMATGERRGIASFRKVIPTPVAVMQCQTTTAAPDKIELRAPPSYGINAKPPSQCPELEAEGGNYEAGMVEAARFKKSYQDSSNLELNR